MLTNAGPVSRFDGRSLVLVVDDDAVIRRTVSEILAEEGYEVVSAANGRQALERVAERMPALVLLDMRMPEMDGWAFLDGYRALPGPLAPVVICSAAVDAERRASEVQADGVIGKPFDLDQLVEVVARFAGRPMVSGAAAFYPDFDRQHTVA